MPLQPIPTLQLFLYFLLVSFTSAMLLFLVMWSLIPDHEVFATTFRMYPYHLAVPEQYIFLVCLIYALICALLVRRLYWAKGGARLIIITVAILASLILSTVPGGMLWVLHDMQAGFFPTQSRMLSYLMFGAREGFWTGLGVIAFSIPYNLIGLAAAYGITWKGFEVAEWMKSKKEMEIRSPRRVDR